MTADRTGATRASGPRIAPGTRRDVGLPIWVFSRLAGRVSRSGPPNLFLTLGRHRRLFRGWLSFARRLMPGGTLARRDTELAILRVATLCECGYELEHHSRLARRAGLTDEEIDRVGEGSVAPGWDDRDRVILAAVEECISDDDISDDTWGRLRRHFGDAEVIELVLLAAHYRMLATAIRALRIQPDVTPL